LAVLEWDKTGERLYEIGVDRGVLYLQDGSAVAWNGLRGVEESYDRETAAFYIDGVKYLQRMTPGDFTGHLRAYTYPEEFDAVLGSAEAAQGMFYHGQPPKPFHLSYRTRIGNDLDGIEHGYKLHVLYNIMAQADTMTFNTLEENITPAEFGWALTGVPVSREGYRPVVHISIDSTKAHPEIISTVESILYGTSDVNPRLPDVDEITGLMEMYGSFVVIDNGDGTWTGVDLANQFVTMDSPTQFTVNNVDASYSDTDTYTVSTTNPE